MYVSDPFSRKRSHIYIQWQATLLLQTANVLPLTHSFHSFLCWKRILSIIPQSSLVVGLSSGLS